MNQDSSHAKTEEDSATPWETIDADELAASADQAKDGTEDSGTENSGTGAPPVVLASTAPITDPFDPGDEPTPQTVQPVPSPAEAGGAEDSTLAAKNLESPLGTPSALNAAPTDVAQGPISASSVGSAPRNAIPDTDGIISTDAESVRTADPTSIAADLAPPAIDEDLAEEAAVPAVIEAKSFFAQSIVDADVPSDEDEGNEQTLEREPVWEDPEMADSPAPQLTGASWTIPLLCAGIGLIACCIVIPQADANRRLAYEKMTLQADLQSVQKQVTVNDEFLKKVVDDPSLAERLAQRQLKRVRKGQHVLRLKEERPQMSPFQITNVEPPPPPPPYKPIGGILASLCYDARTRLYLMGISMAMIACGLVMGATPGRKSNGATPN